MVRLGDGTDESRERMQRALDRLWPYTGEMFAGDAIDATIVTAGIGPDPAALHTPWLAAIDAVCADATLVRPQGE